MVEPNAAPHPGPDEPSEGSAGAPFSDSAEPTTGSGDGESDDTRSTTASGTHDADGPQTSGHDADTTDREFARIVASLDDLPGWEDAVPAPERQVRATFPAAPWVRPLGPRDAVTDDAVAELEDEQSHFVPPEPPPLFGGDPLLTMAWVAVLCVPVSAFAMMFGPRPTPTAWIAITGAVLLAGLGVLLWRMPHRRDADSEGDRGAQV